MTSVVPDKENASEIDIFNVLNIDFSNIERGVEVLNRESPDQEINRVLFKQKDSEMLIFNKIEIQRKRHIDSTKVYLKKTDSKSILLSLKLLTDKLYEIYGEDDYCRKRFSLNDFLDMRNGTSINRVWENVKYPTILNFEKGNAIELNIELEK